MQKADREIKFCDEINVPKKKKNVPGGIRTPDPRLRRPLLYPTELLAQAAKLCQAFPIKKQEEYTNNNQSLLLIGVTGFEPATSRSLTERSTKLSHTPLSLVPKWNPIPERNKPY